MRYANVRQWRFGHLDPATRDESLKEYMMDKRRRSAEQQRGKPTTVGTLTHLADATAQLLDHRARQARDATAPAIGSSLRAGVLLAGSALVALLGLQALVAAAIAALGSAVPIWGAALIAGAVLLAVAGLAAMIGAHRLISAVAALKSQDPDVEGARPAETPAGSRG